MPADAAVALLFLGSRMLPKLFAKPRGELAAEKATLKIETYLEYLAAQGQPVLLPEKADHRFLESIFDGPIFNPSVLVTTDGNLVCIARSSQIRHFRKWHPEFVRVPPNIDNAWITLDRNLDVIKAVPVDDSLLRKECPEASFGIEDVRLFNRGGQIWGLGTGMTARSDKKSKSCALLVRFEGSKIVEFSAIKSPVDSVTEKNWTPVVKEDGLDLIYSYKPLVVLRYKDGHTTPLLGAASPDLPHIIRGSTCTIPWGENLLSVVHFPPVGHPSIGKEKKYGSHAFLLMNDRYEILEISDPFFIHRRGIEFATGLADLGDHLLLSYGIGDRIAAIAKIPKDVVRHYIVTSDSPTRISG
jgi:hypothetical protein